MLYNYLKIAFRNVWKQKGYSLINILGLAVGIAVCMLIYLFVSHKLSYDTYHEKSERTYRVTLSHPQAHVALTPSMVFPTARQLFPEVETGVRLFDVGSFQPLIVRNGQLVFEERDVVYADSTLFQVFDFPLLSGDSRTALARPASVVITEEVATRYFGDMEVLGRSLTIGSGEYEITGVMKSIPENSHFQFDFFISMISRSGWAQLSDTEWRSANFYTYIVLDQGTRQEAFAQKINAYAQEQFADNPFASVITLNLEPLEEIHLYSTVTEDIRPQGDIRYVLAAGAIAIIVLVIACINYMNLATARSSLRAREVGIRKVLGSERNRIVGQFYGESAFMTFIAILFSVLLMELFMPWFNQLTGQSLSADYASWQFWGMILAVGGGVTLLAGSYPALMLSSFQPAAVLKGGKLTSGRAGLRRFLVVFQFTASIFLIISTLVVYQQIEFMQQKELGYKQDNVLVLTTYGGVESRFDAFRSQLQNVTGFQEAAMASDTPTNISATYGPDVEGVDEGPNYFVQGLRVTPDFIDALNIEVIAGRSFTEGDYTRANQEEAQYAIMVNESAAQSLGISPDELIGRYASISYSGGEIIGVVKDFHFTSLHRPIGPLFIFPQDGFNKVLVSFSTTDIGKTLEETRRVWEELFPQYPFEYQFLDQEYNALYEQEMQAGYLFTSFSVLAIFIACLGLVGLASFMVEQRTREVGIRKVMGATSAQVVRLFSRDFLVLVLIGFVISVPLAWYVMGRWLENFAYRIEMQWVVFLMAGFATLFIAFLTVSWQAVKASRLDPATSLRAE